MLLRWFSAVYFNLVLLNLVCVFLINSKNWHFGCGVNVFIAAFLLTFYFSKGKKMKYINLAKKFAQQKYQQLAVAGSLAVMSTYASAAGIEDIGTQVATEIAKFAIMITAIGTAILSVVVLVQGFRVAFGMTKTAR